MDNDMEQVNAPLQRLRHHVARAIERGEKEPIVGVDTMKTDSTPFSPIRFLRAFARHETHGGYSWGLVMADGALLCEKCTLENYRQIFRETKGAGRFNSGWQVVGLTNSGEAESADYCAHCNKLLWEGN